jgi:hypothetical protein
MSFVTSTTNPNVFSGVTAILPQGFHYILQNISGVNYTYGEKNAIYQMGVVRESDGSVIWGKAFYPYNGYPSAAAMVNTECQAVYNTWSEYSSQDAITTEAQQLIGF